MRARVPYASSLRQLTTFRPAFSPVRSKVPPTPPPFRAKPRQKQDYGVNEGPWQENDIKQGVWEQPYEEPSGGISYEIPSGGLINANDAVTEILGQPMLIIERKLELMNVFLGFEQANRYSLMDTEGNVIGFLEEEDFGIGKAIMRQIYRLHRPFTVRLYNRHGQHVLTIRRPFSFINSHIKAILPSSHEENQIVVGESRQSWHLWRRRYNMFLASGQDEFDQFGKVDAPFLSFSFPMKDENGLVLGSVDRNWVGFGRELFTDTGVYLLRMDPSALAQIEPPENLSTEALTLDQRAVLLSTAISIDFDYFSRHSGRGGVVGFGDYD